MKLQPGARMKLWGWYEMHQKEGGVGGCCATGTYPLAVPALDAPFGRAEAVAWQ